MIEPLLSLAIFGVVVYFITLLPLPQMFRQVIVVIASIYALVQFLHIMGLR